MNRRKITLLLLGLTLLAAILAMFLFHRLDDIRGYHDARANTVSELYAWTVGFLAALAVFREKCVPVAFGFLAGSMLFLSGISLFVYFRPLNPAMTWLLMNPVGAMGAILGWKAARRRKLRLGS